MTAAVGEFFGALVQIPTPAEATTIAAVMGIFGTALLLGLRALRKELLLGLRAVRKEWIDALKERDQALAGTLTRQVEDLSAQLTENQRDLNSAREEANRHAQAAQELRHDLQNLNSLYLQLAGELAKANHIIQEQTALITSENAENVRLRHDVFILSEGVSRLSGAISGRPVPGDPWSRPEPIPPEGR